MATADTILQSWQANRQVYIRVHLWLTAIGAVGATAVLYALGNPDYWVGVIAALLAVGVRGWYLASEDLTTRWDLTADALESSQGRRVALAEIATVRALGSAVQIITHKGDKVLMKYMADPGAVQAAVAQAAGVKAA